MTSSFSSKNLIYRQNDEFFARVSIPLTLAPTLRRNEQGPFQRNSSKYFFHFIYFFSREKIIFANRAIARTHSRTHARTNSRWGGERKNNAIVVWLQKVNFFLSLTKLKTVFNFRLI